MWRIYRLPGSREVWHIDSGCGTAIFNVRKYLCSVPSHSVDIGGNNVPRAWIEISGDVELHIVKGTAIFGKIRWAKETIPPISEQVTASVPIPAEEISDAAEST